MISRDFKVKIHDTSIAVVKNTSNKMLIKGTTSNQVDNLSEEMKEQRKERDIDYFIKQDIEALTRILKSFDCMPTEEQVAFHRAPKVDKSKQQTGCFGCLSKAPEPKRESKKKIKEITRT